MFGKRIVILGLFLAAGFLFFSVSTVKAVTYTWNGAGDAKTWTDPGNWGNTTSGSYAGATTTDAVTIAPTASTTIYATSTLAGGLSTLTLGGGAGGNGPTLIIGNNTIVSASSTVAVVGTSTLQLSDSNKSGIYGSGTLKLAQTAAGAPLNLAPTAHFTPATGTVAYIGGGTADIYVATTTFYNLQLTPTSTAAIRTYKFGAGNTLAQSATTTVSNVFTISTAAKADFQGITDLVLSGSDTPFSKAYGDFMQSSKIVYSSALNTNIATGTYANLSISGTSIKTLLGNTTATSTVSIESGTLAVGSYTFTVTSGATFVNSGTITIGASGIITATGVNWTNSGTITETADGKITYASATTLADSGGNAKSGFNADTRDWVYFQVTDKTLNLKNAEIETLTCTITAASLISDTETVTLYETDATTGVFLGGVQLAMSGSNVLGQLDYQGGGSLSVTWVDKQDATDTGTSKTGTFTGTAPGGGSSGAAAVTTTTAVTSAPTTVTTTVTPAAPAATTPTVSAAPTLESVSTKVASVVAKIAALPANPAASDLTSIQAEIVAILTELQTLQVAQTSTPGAALGFSFIKPLTYGLSDNEVTNLQEALKTDATVYPEGKVTGYFGSATLRAVKKFQEKYGIATSDSAGYGRVGPATRAKLNELYGSK